MAGGAGVELVVTGADDGTVRVWEGGDEGPKNPVSVFELGCPITSVCWSADGQNIYAGALDNEIHVSTILVRIHNVPYIDQEVLRSWICVKTNRCIALQDTPTHLPHFRSLQMALTSSRLRSPLKPSYMTCGPSHRPQLGYIES